MTYKDYYKVMGLAKNASQEEIKQTYRKLARKYHPDVSKEPDAENKFKELGEAYEVLKDPEKRAKYDQYGEHWQQPQFHEGAQGYQHYDQGEGGINPGDFDDFLSRIFRQRYQQEQAQSFAEDTHAKLSISLEESFHGAEKTLQLQQPVLSPHGGMEYKTRAIKVKIPKGIQDKQTIRLKGQGNGKSDLYIEINLAPHHLYKVDKKNILLKTPISPWEAALGLTIEVPTLGGFVHLKIPPLSQSGKQMRLNGRGLPGNPPGDQMVVLEIVIPETMNPEAKEAYEKLSQSYHFNPRAK